MPGEPLNMFMVCLKMPDSSSRIAWPCAASRIHSSLGVVNGSSALLEWHEFVAFMYDRISSVAVRVRLFLNSAAINERPLVCVCNLHSCALGPAPNTSRIPIAQIRRDTRESAMYSASSPQSKKNERRGPN